MPNSPKATILTGALVGIDGHLIRVEVDLLDRLPAVRIVGLPGSAAREATARVRSAIWELGVGFPRKRMVINLVPADLRKTGCGFDLPIAVGVLVAAGRVPAGRCVETMFVGELSRNGAVRGTRGMASLALAAEENGLKRIVCPEEVAAQAAISEGIEVLVANRLEDVVKWLRGEADLQPRPLTSRYVDYAPVIMGNVQWLELARRALEIAAAGGHNLMMIAPPGSSKSTLAAHLLSILPEMSPEEAIDVTRVHSAARLLGRNDGLVTRRPLRAPHHTVSIHGLLGSGVDAQPGEVSLAHRGVLFLNDAAEFSRIAGAALQDALSARRVTLLRAPGTVEYPADTQIVLGASPCPCGFDGHPSRSCGCSDEVKRGYRDRLNQVWSGLVDVTVRMEPVPRHDFLRGKAGESSAAIRARVTAARARQRDRYGNSRCNAELAGDAILAAASLTDAAATTATQFLVRTDASRRARDRLLMVARTIADLAGAKQVDTEHVIEATGFTGDCA